MSNDTKSKSTPERPTGLPCADYDFTNAAWPEVTVIAVDLSKGLPCHDEIAPAKATAEI